MCALFEAEWLPWRDAIAFNGFASCPMVERGINQGAKFTGVGLGVVLDTLYSDAEKGLEKGEGSRHTAQ